MGRHFRLSWPSRGVLVLAALALCAGTSGCKRTPKREVQEAPPPEAPPPDRLAPGQLMEGDLAVFGIQLPEKTRILAAFRESASASGEYPPEELAAYLKPRLDISHVEIAGNAISFPKVRVRGHAERLLRLEIFPAVNGCVLRLRDITPPKALPGLSEEERWRRVGMKPNGELIDPQGLE